MEKLRLLMLNASSIYGGGEYYVLQLAKHLKNRGHFVIVGCRENNLLTQKCSEEGIPTEAIGFGGNGSKNLFKNISWIKEIANKNSINIIHTNTGIDRTAGAVAAKRAKAKHVTSCHSLVSVRRNITHYIRNNYLTHAFIADGVTIKELLINKDKVSEKKIFVINNGISPEEMKRDEQKRNELRKSFNISENDIVIGNTARLVYFKGHKYLLNAFASLAEKHNNVKLLLVGSGELKSGLMSYTHILNIMDKVIFAGFRDDLKEIYSAFDIYVHPSIDGGGELFPFTVLYAMAQSLPVVASGIGDLPNMIEDGETGFVIDQRSPFQIAEKLEILINDPSLRCSLGKEGYKKLLNEFTIDKMVDNTEKLYYSLRERL